MEDNAILDLYFSRSEQAIVETDQKYGGFCYSIAYQILCNREDSEESVSDTYLSAWNAIPPTRPGIFSSFLGKITRNLSLDRWRRRSAAKRGGGEVPLALEELEQCVGDGETPEQAYQRKELEVSINRFLDRLPATERNMFLCRYWYLDSVGEIADIFGFTTAKVNSMLYRTREKLRRHLEKEGYC